MDKITKVFEGCSVGAADCVTVLEGKIDQCQCAISTSVLQTRRHPSKNASRKMLTITRYNEKYAKLPSPSIAVTSGTMAPGLLSVLGSQK